MLSTTAMFNPGLAFATLVVQFVTARASPVPALDQECLDCDNSIIADSLVVDIPVIYRRRMGAGEGCESNGEHCSSTTGMSSSSPTGVASPTATISNSTTPAMTNTSAPSSGSPTSSSTSSSQTSVQTSVAIIHDKMSISTGGIIGTAFGAFVLVVATLIISAILYRRWKRSHNNAQSPSNAKYGSDLPPQFGTLYPQTEMSQTDSSPLVALALATRMASAPRHHSTPPSTTGSTSPLIGPASLNHSLSITTSSNRRTSLSYTDGGSSHERLQHIQEMQAASPMYGSEHQGSPRSDASGGLAAIILGSTTPTSPRIEPSDSNLVRAMTAYQKSLEADDRKSAQSGASTSNDGIKQEEQDITESQDPPPRYDA